MYKRSESFGEVFHNFLTEDGKEKVIVFRETRDGLKIDQSTCLPTSDAEPYLRAYFEAYIFYAKKQKWDEGGRDAFYCLHDLVGDSLAQGQMYAKVVGQ